MTPGRRHGWFENAASVRGRDVHGSYCGFKDLPGEAYRNNHPLEYYEKGAARLGKMIHPDTAKLLHELLKMLAEEGEEKLFHTLSMYC